MSDIIGPIFLLASERSGSNLTARIFGSHSEVSAPVPSHIMRYLALNLFRYGDLSELKNWETLIADAIALQDSKAGLWETSVTKSEILSEDIERNLASLITYIFAKEMKNDDKKTIFFKENQVYQYFPFIFIRFPDARFIHIVRDPRDMAASWVSSTSLRGGVVRATHVWRDDQLGFLRIISWLQDTGRLYASTTYEDLVARPQDTVSNLCKGIALPFEERMLRFHDETITKKNAELIRDWSNTSRSIVKTSSGKWKVELNERQIAYIEHHCRDLMTAFQYETITSPMSTTAASRLHDELASEEPNTKSQYAQNTEGEIRLRAYREKVLDVIYSHIPR